MTRQKEIYNPTSLYESIQLRVRFSETDPLGIVWHGNYIKYFEDAREAFGRKYGISYLDVERHGFATPIVKSVCEHKKIVRYGELLEAQAHYMDTTAAKLVFHYLIYNAAKELVCTGETIQVFTTLKEGTLSLYNPEFYEQWRKQHL